MNNAQVVFNAMEVNEAYYIDQLCAMTFISRTIMHKVLITLQVGGKISSVRRGVMPNRRQYMINLIPLAKSARVTSLVA